MAASNRELDIAPDPIAPQTWESLIGASSDPSKGYPPGVVPLASGPDGHPIMVGHGTPSIKTVIPAAAVDVAGAGWVFDGAFSVTDVDTVAWGAGTLTTEAETTYSIGAGNTGDMTAKTYIYFDSNVSTTAFQTTTTAATAVGAGKILIAVANLGADEATFFVLNSDESNIDGANIAARSLTANEIVANEITANELSTSLAYTGVLQIDQAGHIRGGQTAYNTGEGFWIGKDGGVYKLSIGSRSVSSYNTIAHDATSNSGEQTSTNTSTHSHTCTSGAYLFVLISTRDTTDADRVVSTVTYDGSACTPIQINDNGDLRRTEIWAISNPSSGANNIVVTTVGSITSLNVVGVSLTNVNNVVAVGGVSKGGSATSESVTLTTEVDNSWILGILETSGTGTSYVEGSGQTSRTTTADTNQDVHVSTKVVSTAGASSMSWSWTNSAWRSLSVVALQPTSTVTPSSSLTWDGASLSVVGVLGTQVFFDAVENISSGDAVFISAGETTTNSHSADFEAGSTQWLEIEDANQTGLDITGDMTIETWVNVETAPSSSAMVILAKWSSGAGQRSYLLRYIESSGLKLEFNVSANGSATSQATVATDLGTGTWHHVAVSYDASAGTCEFYVDGQNIGSGSGSDRRESV